MVPNFKDTQRGNDAAREFLRCEERVHMFQCLVIYISRDKIYYVHARARYSHYSQPPFSGHVCGAGAEREHGIWHTAEPKGSSTFHKEYALLMGLRHGQRKNRILFAAHRKRAIAEATFSATQGPHPDASRTIDKIAITSDHFHLLVVCRYATKLVQ